jgi:hypothetical protein
MHLDDGEIRARARRTLEGALPDGWPRAEVVAELGFEGALRGFRLEGLAHTAAGTPVRPRGGDLGCRNPVRSDQAAQAREHQLGRGQVRGSGASVGARGRGGLRRRGDEPPGRRTTGLGFGFPGAAARLVDLRERPVAGGELGAEPAVTLRPFQFVTVRVERGLPPRGGGGRVTVP